MNVFGYDVSLVSVDTIPGCGLLVDVLDVSKPGLQFALLTMTLYYANVSFVRPGFSLQLLSLFSDPIKWRKRQVRPSIDATMLSVGVQPSGGGLLTLRLSLLWPLKVLWHMVKVATMRFCAE